jgi:hypothetical protein
MTLAGVTPIQRIVALRPAAWYQLGRGTVLAAGSTTLVARWNDASGNNRPLLQATGAAQPALQTDGTLLFDGSSDLMQTATFTLAQPTMLYMLFRQVTWTINDVMCDGFTATSGQLIQANTTPEIDISAGSTVCANTGLAVNTYGIFVATFSGANSTSQVNKKAPIAVANAGTTSMAGFTLGSDSSGANNSNIQVKEVLLFGAAHNQTQQYQVINYLSLIGGLGL